MADILEIRYFLRYSHDGGDNSVNIDLITSNVSRANGRRLIGVGTNFEQESLRNKAFQLAYVSATRSAQNAYAHSAIAELEQNVV